MTQRADSAPEDLNQLQQWLEQLVKSLQFSRLVAAVVAVVTRLRNLNTELAKQLVHLRKARPRSERLRKLEGQLSLPWTMSAPAGDAEKPTTTPSGTDAPEKKPGKSRKGEHSGRNPFPPELERIPEYNRVPLNERRCPKCGYEMKVMGHTDCEYLDVIPAKVVVIRRTDEALKCKLDDTIVTAPAPPRIVARGILGNRIIIEATADKFLDHQPIERQCLRYERAGVELAPQTLGRAVATHLDLLAPLAQAIHDKTRQPGLLATDATGCPVLDRDAAEGIRTGTMWCWTNALWVSFFYSVAGDSDSVRRFLGPANHGRTVQGDGTSILTFLERAGGKRPGCWSHARRGLVACARSGDRIAFEGVKLIAPLFLIERQAKEAGDNAEQRRARRQEHSRQHIEHLRAWVERQRGTAIPNTPLGKALGYLHRQWHRLILFLEDGNIPLTNNRRERELRKLVLGRRNWLFVWGDVGAERTANILTIVATCISHGINPREYLVVTTQLLLEGATDIPALLPDRIIATHPQLRVPSFDAAELPD